MQSVLLRAAAAVAVAIAVIVVVGRWERSSEISAEINGMERVRALVGPLDQRELTGYRIQSGFDCLVYRRGTNPVALELCAQRDGRVVEAIDRRNGRRRFYSLLWQPSASTVRVDRATFDGLVDRIARPSG